MRLLLALQSICRLVRPQFGAPVGVAIGAVGIPIGHELLWFINSSQPRSMRNGFRGFSGETILDGPSIDKVIGRVFIVQPRRRLPFLSAVWLGFD